MGQGYQVKHYTFENAAVCLAGVDAAREFLEPILVERDRELLVVALCDKDVRLLQLLTFPGSDTHVRVCVSDVMRRAVEIECSGIILAHNHPSGDQSPSSDDLRLTRQIGIAGEALDVTILDHMIFNCRPVFSFRSAGLL